MTLDLDELTQGWDCPPGELRARLVVGRDGNEVLQLRVDLGVMQMLLSGRPDGARYRGFPSAREYIEHEQRVDSPDVAAGDWQELQRELQQTNYRRLAFVTLAEEALQANDTAGTCRHLQGALDDVEVCLRQLWLLSEHGVRDAGLISLRPMLLFDRARLWAQLHVVQGQIEEAIEQAEEGAATLETILTELGYDDEQRDEDSGVRYLRDLSHQLRREYGVTQTLRERLEEALENEDFEIAAEIRDELRRRGEGQGDTEEGDPSHSG